MSNVTYGNVPERYLKVKKYHYYHAFTDNKDAHFNILDFDGADAKEQAYNKVKEWKQAGETNLRIYVVEEVEDYRDGIVETISEDCVFSEGNYPY